MHPKMLHYHPIRYGHQMRDFFVAMVEAIKRSRELGDSDGYMGLLAGTMFEHRFQEFLQRRAEQVPGHILEHLDWWGPHLDHVRFAYQCYRNRGENIFHFNPTLTEMLSVTDIDAVTLDEFRLPFSALYIHFEAPLPFSPTHGVDGVYIHEDREGTGADLVLFLSFTTVALGADYSERQPLHDFLLRDHSYSLVLPFDKGTIVGQALAGALEDESEEEHWDSEYGLDWLPQLKSYLGTLISCLFYLDYEGQEITEAYPPFAPPNLLTRATVPQDTKDKHRATRKLEALGFRRIHFCGESLRDFKRPSVPTGRTVASHWRRGHWRQQAYGTGYGLHKKLWIRPVLIRPDEAPPKIRHIYVPDPPAPSDSETGTPSGTPAGDQQD